MSDIVIFAFKGNISSAVLKKLNVEKKFYLDSDNKEINKFASELKQLQPKFIVGLGMYSKRDKDKLRIETECTKDSKKIDITHFIEPGKNTKLAKGIGNSYCNYISAEIMSAIEVKRLKSSYTFIHIPKSFSVNKAVEEIEAMLSKFEELYAKVPKSFDEFYKALTTMLVKGTKEQQAKVWALIQRNDWEWPWIRARLITETYDFADAKAKEEFCLIAIEQHVKAGSAMLLEEIFIDQETGIKYRQYRKSNNHIYKIPFVTDTMDKYTYDQALNKKFLGDFIETWSVGGIAYTPLDTKEKVNDYNNGVFYKRKKKTTEDINK